LKIKVTTLIEVTNANGGADPTPFDPLIEKIVESVQGAAELALERTERDGFDHKLDHWLNLHVKAVQAQVVPEPGPKWSGRGQGIPATFCTGDGTARAEFDAAPWFLQAGVEEIVDLAAEDWSGGYGGDEVAAWFDGKDADVTAVYEYIRAVEELPNEVEFGGSDFTVKAKHVLNWLREHRPEVAVSLDKGG
jgi:hypothetical protein